MSDSALALHGPVAQCLPALRKVRRVAPLSPERDVLSKVRRGRATDQIQAETEQD